jgi:hypothetical protein
MIYRHFSITLCLENHGVWVCAPSSFFLLDSEPPLIVDTLCQLSKVSLRWYIHPHRHATTAYFLCLDLVVRLVDESHFQSI